MEETGCESSVVLQRPTRLREPEGESRQSVVVDDNDDDDDDSVLRRLGQLSY